MGRVLQALPTRPEGDDWWKVICLPEAAQGDEPTLPEELLAVADRIFDADQTARTQLERRAELAAERETLLEYQRRIDRRNLARQRIVDDAAGARERIAAFDTANAQLIDDAEQERRDILRDAPIRTAYDEFLTYLRRFKNELPGMLIEGLGDLARDL